MTRLEGIGSRFLFAGVVIVLLLTLQAVVIAVFSQTYIGKTMDAARLAATVIALKGIDKKINLMVLPLNALVEEGDVQATRADYESRKKAVMTDWREVDRALLGRREFRESIDGIDLLFDTIHQRALEIFQDGETARTATGGKAEAEQALSQAVTRLFELTQKQSALLSQVAGLADALDAYISRERERLARRRFLPSAAALATALASALLLVFFGRFMVSSIQRPISSLTKAADELAAMKGDLTQRVPVLGEDEIGKLAGSFNMLIGSVRDMMVHVRDAGLRMTSAATQLRGSAEQQSSGATEQSAIIREAVRTLEALARTAGDVAENAQTLSASARTTVDRVDAVNQKIAAMTGGIASLGRRSEAIGQITRILDGLAGRTRLLALNATIEAARAGETGKGFAVVAAEIRKLAAQSAESTEQIRRLIAEIQADTEKTVQGAEDSMNAVRAGVEQVGRTAGIIEEITRATQDQRRGALEVVDSIRSVDTVSGEFAKTTEGVAASALQIEELAVRLQRVLGQFKLD